MKNIVCVFAHPDDEAFGPGGTIAKFAKNHNVYILCATKGEEGLNALGKGSISKIREKELLRAAKILGVKKVIFLGFKDGELSNNLYHKLASKIRSNLLKLKPSLVLTYEPRGVTGHIDHIVVSLVTMFVARKLKFVKTVMQFCKKAGKDKIRDYFVYVPPGYKESEIDLTVNVKDVWEIKLSAMRQHKSQAKDLKEVLKTLEKSPKEEHFLIKNF